MEKSKEKADVFDGYEPEGELETVDIGFELTAPFIAGIETKLEAKGLMIQTRDRGVYKVDITFPFRTDISASTWGTDEDTCDMLTGLVRALKPRVILETGTHRGRGTMALYHGVKSNGQGVIYSIDQGDYCPPEVFSGCDSVHLLRGTLPDDAYKLLPEGVEVDFAFLDASHSYSGVYDELKFVKERGAKGWVALVDNYSDTTWPGIAPAVRDFCMEHDAKYIVLDTLHGMAMVQMR